eukprot:PhM_4_TR18712/c0_g1_i5/m.62254
MQWSSEKKGPSLTLSADSTTATGATQSLRGQQALAPDGGSYSVKISLVSSPAEKGTGLGAGTYVGVCSDAFTNFAARYDDVRDATEAVWAVQDLHDEDDQATCVAPWKQHLNAHGRVFGHDETVTITRDGGTLYFQRDNGERVVAFRDLPLGPLYPFVHLDSKNVSATISCASATPTAPRSPAPVAIASSGVADPRATTPPSSGTNKKGSQNKISVSTEDLRTVSPGAMPPPAGGRPKDVHRPLPRVAGPGSQVLEDLDKALRERRRLEKQKMDQKRSQLKELHDKLEERAKESAMTRQEIAMQKQKQKEDEAQRRAQQFQQREAERLERLSKLRGVDVDVFKGKKNIEDVIKARDEQLRRQEEEDRRKRLAELHSRQAMGAEFYQNIKDHEAEVQRRKEQREALLKDMKPAAIMKPIPTSKAMEKIQRQLEEERRQLEERERASRARRDKTTSYGAKVLQDHRPKHFGPAPPPAPTSSSPPRPAVGTHERYTAGNDYMRKAGEVADKSKKPIPPPPEEPSEVHRRYVSGNEYMQQGKRVAAPGGGTSASYEDDDTYVAEVRRLREKVKAVERGGGHGTATSGHFDETTSTTPVASGTGTSAAMSPLSGAGVAVAPQSHSATGGSSGFGGGGVDDDGRLVDAVSSKVQLLEKLSKQKHSK